MPDFHGSKTLPYRNNGFCFVDRQLHAGQNHEHQKYGLLWKTKSWTHIEPPRQIRAPNRKQALTQGSGYRARDFARTEQRPSPEGLPARVFLRMAEDPFHLSGVFAEIIAGVKTKKEAVKGQHSLMPPCGLSACQPPWSGAACARSPVEE